MILFYTSFLFGIVYIYGIHVLHWMGPAFFCLTILSSTNYYCQYRYKEIPALDILRTVDRSYAHLLTFATAVEAYYTPWHPYLYVYWICFVWMFYVFWISNKSNCKKHGEYWHATLHSAAVVGACSLLSAQQTST